MKVKILITLTGYACMFLGLLTSIHIDITTGCFIIIAGAIIFIRSLPNFDKEEKQ